MRLTLQQDLLLNISFISVVTSVNDNGNVSDHVLVEKEKTRRKGSRQYQAETTLLLILNLK